MSAAGSAVGLGNIWAFPNQVASNGGAAFLLVYLVCCFSVGYPLIVAELTIGRHTGRNPVGALRALAPAAACTRSSDSGESCAESESMPFTM